MKLLLVEDQPSLLDAVSVYLKRHGFVVDGVSTVKSAKHYLLSSTYDGVLLDLSLPDGDGIEFLKTIRQSGIRTPIIIMTARDQISDRIRGLEAGADDYVVKPCDLDEVIARLNAVLRRTQGGSVVATALGRFAIDRSAHRLTKDGTEIELRAKEWAIIERLTRHADSIVSKSSLEEGLFSINDEVVSNSLEVHISRIRKKIGRAYIDTVRGLGYRFVADANDEI